MEKSLNQKINEMQQEIIILQAKLNSLSQYTEEKPKLPQSIVGDNSKSLISPVDAKVGLGRVQGNAVVWNDGELRTPPLNEEAEMPEEGYNKHSHSRYSGGALVKDIVEIVEIENLNDFTNPHSQQHWQDKPVIATTKNTNEETVEKIGILNLIFNADSRTWGTATYEIDVKKCFFVERGADGMIATDSKDQLKISPLFNEDETKSAIVWDENARVWRFYAVYAPGV